MGDIGEITATCAFECTVCGRTAERFRVVRSPGVGGGELHRDVFSPTFRAAVSADGLAAVEAAVASGDPWAILRINGNWVSSFCVDCERSYCQDHWDQRPVFDDGFYDYTIGTCPEGHKMEQDD